MAIFRADTPTPLTRKRLLFLGLLAAAGLGVLAWQWLPPTPRARQAARIAAADRLAETGSLGSRFYAAGQRR